MGFVLMQHPKLDGATFASPVSAVDNWESLGWKLVAGRDKDKNLKDVRVTPEAFDLDAPAVEPTTSASATASTKES